MRDRMADVLVAGKKLAKKSEHQIDSVPHKAFDHEKGHLDQDPSNDIGKTDLHQRKS